MNIELSDEAKEDFCGRFVVRADKASALSNLNAALLPALDDRIDIEILL